MITQIHRLILKRLGVARNLMASLITRKAQMLGAEERRLRLYIVIRRKEERAKATQQMRP